MTIWTELFDLTVYLDLCGVADPQAFVFLPWGHWNDSATARSCPSFWVCISFEVMKHRNSKLTLVTVGLY